jgi:hypothetical protein
MSVLRVHGRLSRYGRHGVRGGVACRGDGTLPVMSKIGCAESEIAGDFRYWQDTGPTGAAQDEADSEVRRKIAVERGFRWNV